MTKSGSRSPRPFILISAVLTIVVVGVAIFELDRLSQYKYFKVAGTSMAPTLTLGERVKTTAVKNDAPIARGAMVVLTPPVPLQSGVKLVIKRVVGLPGETISSVNGKVEVNGQPLAEPYLAPATITSNLQAVHLGPNSYFVLGDSRANSADSRLYGPVPIGDVKYRVIGKALRFP